MTLTEQANSIISTWAVKNYRSLGALWGSDDLKQEGLICWDRIENKYPDLESDRLIAILHTSLRNRLLSIHRKIDLEKSFSSLLDDDVQADSFLDISCEDAPPSEPEPQWYSRLLEWAETATGRQLKAASGARAEIYLRSLCGVDTSRDIIADIVKQAGR